MRWIDPDNGEWLVLKQGDVPGTATVDQFNTEKYALSQVMRSLESGLYSDSQVILARIHDLKTVMQSFLRGEPPGD